MATTAGNATLALGEVTRYTEMRHRLLFLLGALVVYRIGTFMPVPGIDPGRAEARCSTARKARSSACSTCSPAARSQRLSIFAMGVMPYISASIILQMMAVVVPTMAAIKKEGESGRRKITQWTRYGTVVLAAFQGFGGRDRIPEPGRRHQSGPVSFVIPAMLTLTAGTLFLMWLGEQITERGIGNGISMIILSGIISGLPAAIGGTLEQVRYGRDEPGASRSCWCS